VITGEKETLVHHNEVKGTHKLKRMEGEMTQDREINEKARDTHILGSTKEICQNVSKCGK
jgi:hypothetical protein